MAETPEKNRSPLVRVPAAPGRSTRIELRMPDSSCNPYLALVVMLRSTANGGISGATSCRAISMRLDEPEKDDLMHVSPWEVDRYLENVLTPGRRRLEPSSFWPNSARFDGTGFDEIRCGSRRVNGMRTYRQALASPYPVAVSRFARDPLTAENC